MKKIIALVLSAIMLVSVFAVPSSATTKADLLALLKTSPVYKYIKSGVENSYNSVQVTDAQAEQLLPLVEQFMKIVDKDLGPTANDWRGNGQHYYSLDQIDAVYDIIYKACDIMGWTMKRVDKGQKSTHKGDYVFYIYDTQGKMIFEYDGDLITDKPVNTAGDVISAATVTDNSGIYLVTGSVFAAAAAALYIALKKKNGECA